MCVKTHKSLRRTYNKLRNPSGYLPSMTFSKPFRAASTVSLRNLTDSPPEVESIRSPPPDGVVDLATELSGFPNRLLFYFLLGFAHAGFISWAYIEYLLFTRFILLYLPISRF